MFPKLTFRSLWVQEHGELMPEGKFDHGFQVNVPAKMLKHWHCSLI